MGAAMLVRHFDKPRAGHRPGGSQHYWGLGGGGGGGARAVRCVFMYGEGLWVGISGGNTTRYLDKWEVQ